MKYEIPSSLLLSDPHAPEELIIFLGEYEYKSYDVLEHDSV